MGCGVSWSEPERLETAEVGVVNGESAAERDFWRARVSENHESAKVGRKLQGSTAAKLSEEAISNLKSDRGGK